MHVCVCLSLKPGTLGKDPNRDEVTRYNIQLRQAAQESSWQGFSMGIPIHYTNGIWRQALGLGQYLLFAEHMGHNWFLQGASSGCVSSSLCSTSIAFLGKVKTPIVSLLKQGH